MRTGGKVIRSIAIDAHAHAHGDVERTCLLRPYNLYKPWLLFGVCYIDTLAAGDYIASESLNFGVANSQLTATSAISSISCLRRTNKADADGL